MFWCFWISQRGKPLRAEHCEGSNHVYFMSPNVVYSISVIKTVVKTFVSKRPLKVHSINGLFSKNSWPVQSFQMFKVCIWVFALSSVEGLTDPAPISLLISCGFVSWGEQCKREGLLYSGRDALATLELWPSGQDLAQASCPRILWEVARPIDTEQHCKRKSRLVHTGLNINVFFSFMVKQEVTGLPCGGF